MPVQIATLSLSGYVVAVGYTSVDHMSTRAGASPVLRISCAPSGPLGKNTTSSGTSSVVPSGVRTDGRPSSTSIHSSSPCS